jgi:hypothetical protein
MFILLGITCLCWTAEERLQRRSVERGAMGTIYFWLDMRSERHSKIGAFKLNAEKELAAIFLLSVIR